MEDRTGQVEEAHLNSSRSFCLFRKIRISWHLSKEDDMVIIRHITKY